MSKRQRTTSCSSDMPAKRAKAPMYKRPVTKPPSIRSIAEKALALAKTVNKSIEKKAIDFTGGTAVTTTATPFHFTAIAQGTAQNQRIGNSIYLTGMAINFNWYISASAAISHIRFVIFQDTQTQPDDTAIAWTELMDNAAILAMINRGSQRNRFKILYDQQSMLGQNSNEAEVFPKVYMPIKKTVEFNGTASSDIQKNGIYGLVISSEATDTPIFNYYARLYYHDA